MLVRSSWAVGTLLAATALASSGSALAAGTFAVRNDSSVSVGLTIQTSDVTRTLTQGWTNLPPGQTANVNFSGDSGCLGIIQNGVDYLSNHFVTGDQSRLWTDTGAGFSLSYTYVNQSPAFYQVYLAINGVAVENNVSVSTANLVSDLQNHGLTSFRCLTGQSGDNNLVFVDN